MTDKKDPRYSTAHVNVDGWQLLTLTVNWELSVQDTIEHVIGIVAQEIRSAMIEGREAHIEVRTEATGFKSSEDSAR